MLSLINCAGFHENNEELQAAMLNKGLEEGRTLLSNPQHTNSLAAEFEAMSENEVRREKKHLVVSFAFKLAAPFLFFVRLGI